MIIIGIINITILARSAILMSKILLLITGGNFPSKNEIIIDIIKQHYWN
jgi:hypothetical protein